jgi:phosphohistidine phosphatase
MPIYLVQHGKCLPKDLDPEKGLTDDGIKEVERIAQVAAQYGIKIERIVHSGKKRARQTAQIMAAALTSDQAPEKHAGLRALDDVIPVADAFTGHERLMIVGHLPFLAKLTSYLILGAVEPSVFDFQNGGIVCLDFKADTASWIIKWTLMPTIA